jgi:bacterioferritin-associated ferredoxin
MLVCHCNVITDRDIKRIIRAFLADDPWQIIVPAKVYRELAKRCKCSGCVPNVIDLITEVTAEYHQELAATAPAPAESLISTPQNSTTKGVTHERRRTDYRKAQRGAVS